MTITTDAGAQAPAAGPVIRDDLTADQYHQDKTSVSSSGLRALLAPGCPAQFKYDRDNPRPPKREFDFGHVAHKLVLGEGDQIEVIDYPDWRTSDAREQRDNAYAEGRIPILTKDYETAAAMAFQVRQHPVGGPLFTPDTGRPELSIFWTDPRTGVRCRCRPDWLPTRQDNGRLVVVDYKTAKAVDPDALARAVYERGYHAQAAFYLDGVKAAGLHGDQEPAFVFVFQSKTAPYLVHLVELDFPALALGAARNERALRIYAECERTGHWPGFNDRITYLPLPAWAERKDHEEYTP